jgi:hypothetical protein
MEPIIITITASVANTQSKQIRKIINITLESMEREFSPCSSIIRYPKASVRNDQ